LRVGAVQYLNTKPLVHGLAAAGVEVAYDLPSRLADRLADGRLEVALIPSIEVFRGGHRIVSAAQHIHGGMGFDRDYPLHRNYLQFKQCEFALGGASALLAELGDLIAAPTSR
jgi:alkylation response protein AidB-like acyl-CoA dehydrogenase